MENNDLMTYPLASLYGWRSPLFVTAQGVSEEAVERRTIRAAVIAEAERRRAPPMTQREVDEYEDLL